MTIRYYLDIQLNAQHGMDVKTKTQIFSNIHRLLKHHEIKDVALGFPAFGTVNATGLPGLGEHLRLVSKCQDNLYTRFSLAYCQQMVGLMVLSAVMG